MTPVTMIFCEYLMMMIGILIWKDDEAVTCDTLHMHSAVGMHIVDIK
jgi:hypothetical protein